MQRMLQSATAAKTSSARPKAFTLIELLVVIAIIAILAAILFPVFAQAREKARQATCLSNNKQIALAMVQYVQDFDEVMPSRYFPNNIGFQCGQTVTWVLDIATVPSLMGPYLKSTDVLKCPSNMANPLTQKNSYNYAYAYSAILASTNYVSLSSCVPAAVPSVITMSQIQTPSAMIIFGDDTQGSRTLYHPTQGRQTWGQNWTSPVQTSTATMVDIASGLPGGNYPIGRHLGGDIVDFADGHAKWMRPEILYDAAQTAAKGTDKYYALNGG